MIPAFVILAVAFAFGLAAFDLFASTGSNEQGIWSLLTYVWMGLWAALGGVLSFAQKVKAGQARWINLGELIGEIFTSAFVGVVTGLLCEAAKFPSAATWALVAVSGHAGGRAIFWLERLMQKMIEKNFGVSLPPIANATEAQPKQGTAGDQR